MHPFSRDTLPPHSPTTLSHDTLPPVHQSVCLTSRSPIHPAFQSLYINPHQLISHPLNNYLKHENLFTRAPQPPRTNSQQQRFAYLSTLARYSEIHCRFSTSLLRRIATWPHRYLAADELDDPVLRKLCEVSSLILFPKLRSLSSPVFGSWATPQAGTQLHLELLVAVCLSRS